MITITQKMILSFLFSAFLFTGIAVLVLFDIFDLGAAVSLLPRQSEVFILPAFFLALFFIFFFYIHLRQGSPEEDDIPSARPPARPRLVEAGSLQLVDEDEIAELEVISTGSGGNISILGQLFAFSPVNPELLQVAGNEVIYQRDGIHYISSEAFTGDGNTEREINNDFAQLVESVVNKA